MFQFLVIQTAFIGDVVLATAVAEKLHNRYPDAQIDFLLRKGNEGLLLQHPFIREILVWDKKAAKMANLMKMAGTVRDKKYSHVINLHRFASSGLITMFSGALHRAGFDKNPLSFCYTRKVKHVISEPYANHAVHEIQRNQQLIADITNDLPAYPKLYPTAQDFEQVSQYQSTPYICISPASVWFTKQFPVSKWVALIKELAYMYKVYLLGGKTDKVLAEDIRQEVGSDNVANLAGQLNFLQSAALMKGAVMNYANDSAPLHFASAMEAPVTAVFCSTVPAFGFGPVNNNGNVVEIKERLSCRPCGLHGLKVCPQQHFNCAMGISNEQLLWWTLNKI